MNTRILGIGLPAVIALGWLGRPLAPGDYDGLARAGILLVLVVLAASGRGWARIVVAIWMAILGVVAVVASFGAPDALGMLLGAVLGVLLLVGAFAVFREPAAPHADAA